MVVELQTKLLQSANREFNEEDHNSLSKMKNLRLSCLTYNIESKWGDETTEFKTKNANEETVYKEDIQNTSKQTYSNTNFVKLRNNILLFICWHSIIID